MQTAGWSRSSILLKILLQAIRTDIFYGGCSKAISMIVFKPYTLSYLKPCNKVELKIIVQASKHVMYNWNFMSGKANTCII